MANEIKMDPIDSISKLLTTKKFSPAVKADKTAQAQDVTVEMKALNGMLVADNTDEDQTRLLEIKHRIETNSYQVDTNTLATKLFEHVFSKTIG